MDIFSQYFSVQLLKQRNAEAMDKAGEGFFSPEKEMRKKPLYLEEVAQSLKKDETIEFPFLMIELKDPNDVKNQHFSIFYYFIKKKN